MEAAPPTAAATEAVHPTTKMSAEPMAAATTSTQAGAAAEAPWAARTEAAPEFAADSAHHSAAPTAPTAAGAEAEAPWAPEAAAASQEGHSQEHQEHCHHQRWDYYLDAAAATAFRAAWAPPGARARSRRTQPPKEKTLDPLHAEALPLEARNAATKDTRPKVGSLAPSSLEASRE